MIVFAGLQTLVNFNPLIKLDGYYMLSDYLEIPNLRTKAMTSLWQWLSRKHPSKQPWKEERAELVKHHLMVLWADFFAKDHFEQFPNLHQLFWDGVHGAGGRGGRRHRASRGHGPPAGSAAPPWLG